MKRAIIVLLGAAALASCGKKLPTTVEPPSAYDTPDPTSTTSDNSTTPDNSGRISSWRIAHVCPDGTNVDLLSDGHYGEWVSSDESADGKGHWTELADGLTPEQGCPPPSNTVREYKDTDA
jgi:hypothetical protein